MGRATRAGPHQMLKSERRKLDQLLWDALVGLGAEFTERPRETGQPYIAELDTRAGLLSVTWFGDWLACRFADPARAAEVLGLGDRRLNRRSGKWSFHFDRVSTSQALNQFLAELKPILAAEPPDREAGRGIVRVVMACHNAGGAPDLAFVRVRCSRDRAEEGAHDDAAQAWPRAQGYQNPFVCFDQNDGPAWLFGHFDWETLALVPL